VRLIAQQSQDRRRELEEWRMETGYWILDTEYLLGSISDCVRQLPALPALQLGTCFSCGVAGNLSVWRRIEPYNVQGRRHGYLRIFFNAQVVASQCLSVIN
jgi:hypothetical protein